MKKLDVILRTPEKIYYEKPAEKVSLSTEEGALEIFPNHTPLTGAISFSQVEISDGDHEEKFLIRNGFVFVEQESKIKILVYACDVVGATDAKTIQEYRDFVLFQLKDPSPLTTYQLQYLKEQKVALEKMVQVFHSPEGSSV